MSVRIRESREGDFDELWRIDQECFPRGIAYSRAELAYYMAHCDGFTLVAELEEEPPIAGFVVGQRHRHRRGHIVTIDVREEARRLGVGSHLMGAAEERLRAGGCDSIYLETAVDNELALQFYKRHGYFVLKTIPRYYMGKIDALLMEKRLE